MSQTPKRRRGTIGRRTYLLLTATLVAVYLLLFSTSIEQADHTNNPNFRYSNDNRELDFGDHDYPSQQSIDPLAKKGERHFYSNDNGGYYPNSNRIDISFVDPVPKKQSPNTNKLWTPNSIINELKMWHDADDRNTLYSDI